MGNGIPTAKDLEKVKQSVYGNLRSIHVISCLNGQKLLVHYHAAAHSIGNDNAEGNGEENDGTIILDPMDICIYTYIYPDPQTHVRTLQIKGLLTHDEFESIRVESLDQFNRHRL